MYIKVLGDQYDGSPLRHPLEDNMEEKKNEEEPNNDDATTSVSSQVQNLGDFIKRCREDRKSIAEQQTTVENKNTQDEPHIQNGE